MLPVVTGKLALGALRLLGRSGNALPGLVVERLFPRYLARTLAALPHGVVVVSGTNGKTTTTKMLAAILSERFRVLTNDTGSNFVRGTIGAAISSSSWAGRLDADVAVFELDEAHAVRFVERYRPERVLLLNVMRDQLDRFGEIDHTARLLRTVAEHATVAVGLNRDDARIAAIADGIEAEPVWYQVADDLRHLFPTDEELYGGASRAARASDGASAELVAWGTEGTTIRIGNEQQTFPLRASGAHNAQNATAAAAMAATFDLSPDVIFAGLRAVEPAFGRGQSFVVDGRDVSLHLVKNPAGFRQSLAAARVEDPSRICIVINDDDADGRDVSWLWDVDFTGLDGGAPVSTAGTRAADMAVRLRYDGVEVGHVDPALAPAIDRAIAATATGERLLVFSTYTAMWGLHRHLVARAKEVRA
ncbi:Mur ligase family protein [Agrococcus versicolor]|uniref:Lipid II isoglutaminyl synthase (glutamine-hydrolyzing) subunit MurT n=2 Tax=Agrococcus versicolor TaxID=501482 RepID=A0ABN3ALH7_9MICO